jgi:hypothetical protein
MESVAFHIEWLCNALPKEEVADLVEHHSCREYDDESRRQQNFQHLG